MTCPAHLPVANFLIQAQRQMDWLTSEGSRLAVSPENSSCDLEAIENARTELLSLINKVSTQAKRAESL